MMTSYPMLVVGIVRATMVIIQHPALRVGDTRYWLTRRVWPRYV
jgi:hypothetical protein